MRMIRGKKTKERLLLVALSIIAEHGLRSLSAGKLAIKASVSKSTIFHHFKNLEDVPVEALAYLAQKIVHPLEVGRYNTLEEYFEHLGKTTFYASEENLKYNRAFFSFYNEAAYDRDPRYNQLIVGCRQKFMEHLQMVIKRFEHGMLNPWELENLSKIIAITIDGYGQHFLIDRDPTEYVMLWRGMSTMFCNYIRSRAKQAVS